MSRRMLKIIESLSISRIYRAHPFLSVGHFWLFGFASKEYRRFMIWMEFGIWNLRDSDKNIICRELHEGVFASPAYVEEPVQRCWSYCDIGCGSGMKMQKIALRSAVWLDNVFSLEHQIWNAAIKKWRVFWVQEHTGRIQDKELDKYCVFDSGKIWNTDDGKCKRNLLRMMKNDTVWFWRNGKSSFAPIGGRSIGDCNGMKAAVENIEFAHHTLWCAACGSPEWISGCERVMHIIDGNFYERVTAKFISCIRAQVTEKISVGERRTCDKCIRLTWMGWKDAIETSKETPAAVCISQWIWTMMPSICISGRDKERRKLVEWSFKTFWMR